MKLKLSDSPGIAGGLFTLKLQASRAAAEEAAAAGKAYYASASTKKQKVDDSVSKLNKRLALIQARIDKLKYPYSTATADGDDEALEQLRGEIRELELEKSQCSSEIGLLQSTFVRGDETLYIAVKEAQDRFLTARNAVIDAARAIDDFDLEKMIKPLVSAASNYRSEYSSGTSLGVGIDMDKLEDHYHAEAVDKRRKEEKALKEARIREARNSPSVTITHNEDPALAFHRARQEREHQNRVYGRA